MLAAEAPIDAGSRLEAPIDSKLRAEAPIDTESLVEFYELIADFHPDYI
jgi:hypothetical protein